MATTTLTPREVHEAATDGARLAPDAVAGRALPKVEPRERAERDLPWWVRGDAVRSILAYLVVPPGLFLIALMFAFRPATDAEHVAAILVGLIGGVLGYYFGSRGVDQFQKIADEKSQAKEVAKETAEDAIDKANAARRDAEARLTEMRANTDYLKMILREARKDDATRAAIDAAKSKVEANL